MCLFDTDLWSKMEGKLVFVLFDVVFAENDKTGKHEDRERRCEPRDTRTSTTALEWHNQAQRRVT